MRTRHPGRGLGAPLYLRRWTDTSQVPTRAGRDYFLVPRLGSLSSRKVYVTLTKYVLSVAGGGTASHTLITNP